jgi:hypothetical protein
MLPRRRNAPRRRVLKTGSIEFADTAIECTVRDISESGAALQVVSPLYIPDRFSLFIQSEIKANLPHHLAHREANGRHLPLSRLVSESGPPEVCCLLHSVMAMLDDSLTNEAPKCERCGRATSLLYSFVDPTSGRRLRTYKCKCGEQTVVPVTRPD